VPITKALTNCSRILAVSDEAMTDIHTIIHAASSPFKDVWEGDVEGTSRLLQAAEKAGVQHFVYISIVGIDKIPYRYYQANAYGRITFSEWLDQKYH
jgi:nucleoside-diphosphate-sugar epimerase